jgi:hypothetical protein
MIKMLMSEDSRFNIPKKAISLIETIIKINVELKYPSLSDKEKKALSDKYSSLLNEAGSELMKSAEKKSYFKEPYLSYFEELAWEWEKLAGIKTTQDSKKKYTRDALKLPVKTDEEIERWFWLLSRNSFKQFKHLQNLSQLEFHDKEEDRENRERCVMGLFSCYLISRFISLKFDLIKTAEKRIQELIQKELTRTELLIERQEQLNPILDKLIEISLHLKDKNLTEEQRTHEKQEQKNYRDALNTLKNNYLKKMFEIGIDLTEEFNNFLIKKKQFSEVMKQLKEQAKWMRVFKFLMSLGGNGIIK